MTTHVGLVLVGRTPRPDFERTFAAQLTGVQFEMTGALDTVDDAIVIMMHDPEGEYPIHIPIARPGGVDIPVASIRPYVQDSIHLLEARGAGAIALLCAGDLGEYACSVPLLSPGRMIPALMRSSLPGATLGIITPIRGQIAYAARKWTENGFTVAVEALPPYETGGDRDVRLIACASTLVHRGARAIVLDCFGFAIEDAQTIYRTLEIPVVGARDIAARAVGMFCGCMRRPS
jgi:protein AroM